MKCWRLLCGSAVSVGAAAEPGVLVSVGRTDVSGSRRLPDMLHLQFELRESRVKFLLRRNTDIHRNVPVAFEGEDEENTHVTIQPVGRTSLKCIFIQSNKFMCYKQLFFTLVK